MNRMLIAGAAFAATATLGALGGPATASTTAWSTASSTTASTTTVSSSGEARPVADPAYKILKHLDYRGPGQASLRLGYYHASTDKGFGWTKVKNKHNITKYSAVEFIAKSPTREHIGGQSYRETGYAGKYTCSRGVCKLVKQYKVLLTVNEKKLRDNHDKGVITQYCVGITRCPNWVTTALSKANSRSVAAAGPERYVGAYRPFAHSVRAADVKAAVSAKPAAVAGTSRYVGAYSKLS